MQQYTQISRPPILRKRVGDLLYNTYTFTECPNFSNEVPYSIHVKPFLYDELIPLHYGSTVEILYCEDLEGVVTVGNQNITFSGGNSIIFIPPFAVHSTNIRKSPGSMYVVKISLANLRHLIDLERICAMNGHHLEQLPVSYPSPEAFGVIIKEMITQDHNIYARLQCLLRLFELFEANVVEDKRFLIVQNPGENDKLRRLIIWTNEHFAERITIQDVANEMSLSKHYFCKYFNATAGTTYWIYLNQVRMVHAASLIIQGKSATECCYECGFESVSYFIQLFKRIYGCTTLQYRNQYNKATVEAKKTG